MGKPGQYLTYSLLATLLGLPVGSVVGGLAFSFYSLATDSGKLADLPAATGLGLFVALVATFLGILPSLAYGAPVYALLARYRLNTYLSAGIIGAIPGGVQLLSGPDLVIALVLLFGICVALATHHFAKRRMSGLLGQDIGSSPNPKSLGGLV